MTKRAGRLVFAAALAPCLLSGCLRQLVQPLPPPRTPLPPKRPAAVEPPPPSPYHPQPDTPPATPDADPAGPLRQLKYPSAEEAQEARSPVRLLSAGEVAAAPAVLPTIPVPPPATPHRPPEEPPQKPEEPLVAALRSFLEKRPDDAVKYLRRYDRQNQELLLCLLPLAARLTDGSLAMANPQDLAAYLDQLDDLAVPMRSRAAMSIEKMCYCRRIEQFGVFEPLPEDHAFHAGHDGQPGELVHVYAELKNFCSESQGPYYVTRLAGSVQVLDTDQKVVWRKDVPPQPDRSQSLRHDYYINCEFCIPRDVPPGSYILVIEVTDLPTGRKARRSLGLRVAGGSLGAG